MRMIALLAVLAAFVVVPTAQAAEVYWDKGSTDFSGTVDPPYPGNGLWNTAVNWRHNNNSPHTSPNNDVLPVAGDRANIALHNLWAEIDAPATITTGDNITISSVRVGTNPGLGVGGHGKLIINGGALTVKDTGDGAHFILGADSNRTGELNMTGGSLTIDDGNRRMILGNGVNTNTVGIVDFQGGTITAKGGLYIAGDDKNANRQKTKGMFTMGTAGDPLTEQTLTTSGANLEVALGGTGTFTQNSGTVNVNAANLIINQGDKSNGTYTLNDGLVDIHNQLRFNGGTGLFEQKGGTVNVGTILDIGNSNGGDGTYTMTGGILNVGDRVNSDLKIGNFNNASTKALMEVIDGTVNISNGIRIGDTGANSSGTLTIGRPAMDTNPQINLRTNLENGDDGAGVVNMYSGTVTITANNNWIIGQTGSGSAEFNMVGGLVDFVTNTTTNGILKANTGDGVVNMTGGTLKFQDIEGANNAAGSTEYNFDGGDVIIDDHLDYRNSGADTVNLNGATLDLTGGDIHFGDRTGTNEFNFTDGTLKDVGTFFGDLVQDGGILAPGASPGTMNITGNYDLNPGGTYQIEIDGTNPADIDYLDIGGYAHLDGVLDLVFGYTPSIGDTFNVLEADNGIFYTPGFGITSDAPGGGGVEFSTKLLNDGTVLQLQYVPEPATLLIWSLLAGLGIGLRWRRRR